MILDNIKLYKANGLDVIECFLDNTRIYFKMTHLHQSANGVLLYDSFMIALIPLMLEKCENLEIKGTVDQVLLDQLNKSILPELCIIHKMNKHIEIKASQTIEIKIDNLTKATGISCGVDSIATVKEFIDSNTKLDYLTFFDAGSHGAFGTHNTEITFNHRLENALKAAENLDLEIIKVRTNVHQLLKGQFKSAHSFLNLSCVFATQGFINEYYYASAYSLNQSSLVSGDTSNYDHYILPQLYASYLNTTSTLGDKRRIERVNYIANFKITRHHLDVCTNTFKANNTGHLNCSTCEKCMRTALSLEQLLDINLFKNVFNLELFNAQRGTYISSLLMGTNTIHDDELLSLLKENCQIKFFHKNQAFQMKLKTSLKSMLKRNSKSTK
ncbi:hypothetical protein BST92_09730 [Nonlabens arenilitoris]|uniref:Uncharacterized protein n=1 Tax=Nonlabens arenilitoris TaxID=1217969 RepID=A0A2S7UC43_9FLAO|nr:hypothetical protein [Nonlabens arenilitoris]PQJ32187.1 hypothetical protein BST92_09730 [Nonlabens arenilitoris]